VVRRRISSNETEANETYEDVSSHAAGYTSTPSSGDSGRPRSDSRSRIRSQITRDSRIPVRVGPARLARNTIEISGISPITAPQDRARPNRVRFSDNAALTRRSSGSLQFFRSDLTPHPRGQTVRRPATPFPRSHVENVQDDLRRPCVRQRFPETVRVDFQGPYPSHRSCSAETVTSGTVDDSSIATEAFATARSTSSGAFATADSVSTSGAFMTARSSFEALRQASNAFVCEHSADFFAETTRAENPSARENSENESGETPRMTGARPKQPR